MSHLLSLVRGCTFDDFLFTPQYSVIERRDPHVIDLTACFSRGLTLKRPIVVSCPGARATSTSRL